VAGPERVLLVSQQQRRLAVEDDEDLLLRRVAVGSGVQLPGLDHLVVEAGALRARRLAEEPRDAAPTGRGGVPAC